MAHAQTREHAHELIDRIAPGQVPAAVELLEKMLDPVAFALANAAFEDEEISEEEELAVVRAKAETGSPLTITDPTDIIDNQAIYPSASSLVD